MYSFKSLERSYFRYCAISYMFAGGFDHANVSSQYPKHDQTMFYAAITQILLLSVQTHPGFNCLDDKEPTLLGQQ